MLTALTVPQIATRIQTIAISNLRLPIHAPRRFQTDFLSDIAFPLSVVLAAHLQVSVINRVDRLDVITEARLRIGKQFFAFGPVQAGVRRLVPGSLAAQVADDGPEGGQVQYDL